MARNQLMQKIALPKTFFALSFDVERDSKSKSGFRPALTQHEQSGGLHQFAEPCVKGFAALLLRYPATRLVVVGGNENRYKDVNRAEAIQEILAKDFGIPKERITILPSNSNTEGNAAAIKKYMEDEGLKEDEVALTGRHYHLPRASLMLASQGLNLLAIPAEAFWLLQGKDTKQELVRLLGGGPLAERLAEEIQGIADRIGGTYVPRVDDPA